MTLLSLPLAAHFDRSNIVAIFILTVVLVAVRFGRGPAALAAVLSVVRLRFFLRAAAIFVRGERCAVPADLRHHAGGRPDHRAIDRGPALPGARRGASRGARRFAVRDSRAILSGAVQIDQVVRISDESIERTFRASAALLLPDASGQLTATASARRDAAARPSISASRSGRSIKGQPAGFGTDTLPGSEVLYIPLRAPTQARGVLAVKARNRRLLRIPEQRQLLDTFAALIAIALERVHYVGVAQDALVRMESERLRNSLLAALSHDLRTPLDRVSSGLAESLALTTPLVRARSWRPRRPSRTRRGA